MTPFLAVYENGVLRPMHPLPLRDGETVRVTASPSSEQPSDEELAAMFRAAKSLEELFAIADAYPDPEPEGYDFFQAMNDNRGPGERLPFPPDLKGKTW